MDYRVSGVMNRSVVSIDSSKTLRDLEALIVEHRLSGFPVVDDGNLVGVVTTSDLMSRLCPTFNITKLGVDDAELGKLVAESVGSVESGTTIKDVMTRNVITVSPTDYLHDAADLMYEHRIHRVFVVDDGEVVGVLTPFDFVRLYATDRLRAGAETKTLDF